MNYEEFIPFMREAIRLAEQGRWQTYPNPNVGAVLVREGKIVAKGWHQAAGCPHAEIECLNDAHKKGIDPAECTLVVTLEPCKHFGKTPPCTQAIVQAGIKKVVFGLKDPHSLASGGAEVLRTHGIEVLEGICEEECRDLVADFLVWQQKKRPYLILKMATTLDGRIATRNRQSQWISCAESRQAVHAMRAGVGQCGGVVLIGGQTFRADNPQLTARNENSQNVKQPLACVLTSHLPQVDANFYLLQKRSEQTIFLVPVACAEAPRAEALRQKGSKVLGYKGDLQQALEVLKQNIACPYVLCEGGSLLAWNLLQAGLVDEFHLYLAPLFLGDNQALPLFDGKSPLNLADGLQMRFSSVSVSGEDLHLQLRPSVQKSEATR